METGFYEKKILLTVLEGSLQRDRIKRRKLLKTVNMLKELRKEKLQTVIMCENKLDKSDN